MTTKNSEEEPTLQFKSLCRTKKSFQGKNVKLGTLQLGQGF